MDSVDNWLSFSKRYAVVVCSQELLAALWRLRNLRWNLQCQAHILKEEVRRLFSPLQDYVDEHVSGTFVNLFRIYCVYTVVVQGMLCCRARWEQ
jgi:hypothetical protein